MTTDPPDKKKLSSAIDRCVRVTAQTTANTWENVPEKVTLAIVKELKTYFSDLGVAALKGGDEELATMCAVVTSGLLTQVLEPYEERRNAGTS